MQPQQLQAAVCAQSLPVLNYQSRPSITRAVPGDAAETKGFSQDVPLSKASIYLLPEAQQVKKSLLNILFYVPSIT